MATERQSPDAIISQSGMGSCAITDIDEDPDSPDSNWCTASSKTSDTDVRVSFPTPTGSPTTGAGLQGFRFQVRLTSGSGSGTPTVRAELWETSGGAAILVGPENNVTSGTGEVFEYTWDATNLGTADGSACEARIVTTRATGPPSVQAAVDIGAVEWNVDYTVGGTTHEASASITASGVAAAAADLTLGISASATASGVVGASSGLLYQVSGSITASGIVGAASNLTLGAQASAEASSILAATGKITRTVAAALTGAATVGASARSTLAVQAGVSASAIVGATGIAIYHASAALDASAIVAAAGTVSPSGTVHLGAASLSASAVVAASPDLTLGGSASISVSGALAAAALADYQAEASLSASAALAAADQVLRPVAASLQATAGLQAAGSVTTFLVPFTPPPPVPDDAIIRPSAGEGPLLLLPVSDVQMDWTADPVGSAFANLDEGTASHDGDATMVRTKLNHGICRLLMEPLPEDLGRSTRIQLHWVERGVVPIDTFYQVQIRLLVNGVPLSAVRSGVHTATSSWTRYTQFRESWYVDSPNDVLELQIEAILYQSTPPSLPLQVFITAIELELAYQVAGGWFVDVDDPTLVSSAILNPTTAYSSLSDPPSLYTDLEDGETTFNLIIDPGAVA